MSYNPRDFIMEFLPFILMALLIVLLVVGSIWASWYKAGKQADVYKRQGIEMTQWECFLGIEPAERVIQVKP